MTKRLGWIGVLSLVCAGVGAGPVLEAQNGSNHGARSNARAAQSQSKGRSPGPGATAPKGEASNRGQHPGASAPAPPSGPAKLPLAGAAQPHPSGVVAAQTPGVPQTPPPQSNQLIESNLHGMNSLAVSQGSGAQTQPSTTGTSKTPPQNQTPPQTQARNQTPAPSSKEEQKPSQVPKPPRGGPPKQPTTPNTQKPNQKPKQTGQPQLSTNGYPPLGRPQPTSLPPSVSPNGFLPSGPNTSFPPGTPGQTQPTSATNSMSDGSPGQTPIENEPNTPTTPQNKPTPEPSGQSQGQDAGKVTGIQSAPTPHPVSPVHPVVLKPPPAVLNLTPSSFQPKVGKKVVVVAALNPSQAGASYQLDWGDGSAVETVSKSGTHRYQKAKMYKVSAKTVVGNSQLHREIVLQVGPVIWRRVIVLLASVAGMGLWSLHMLLNVTTGCRWDVPKVTFVGPQTYVSLSFVPDVGPAEERITFLKTKRRSG